jgi:copper chaperone
MKTKEGAIMASETKTLNVAGMSCMHCVHAIKTAVGSLPGISTVEVDLTGKKVEVGYDPQQVELKTIRDKIIEAGYEVV